MGPMFNNALKDQFASNTQLHAGAVATATSRSRARSPNILQRNKSVSI